jgi:hypothetical protein
LGTAYAIAFPFKAGYSYSLQFSAKGTDGSGYNTNFPTISVSLFNSLPAPDPTDCGAVGQDKWGGLQSSAIVGEFTISQNAANYTIPSSNSSYIAPLTAIQYLIILAYGGSTSINTALISKITISETAPIPFSLTPSSVPITCGSTTPVTFTVNNNNNTSGISDYTWNLGSADNGWSYNGSPAPQTISTGTTNTLALTPVCGSSQSNITATVTAGSQTYTTNASVVSLTLPALSIGSSGVICGSGNYFINNLPCNSSVTWSASPSGIVNIVPSGNNATLTKITDGVVTLTATITSACGNVTPISQTIPIGVQTPTSIIGFGSNGKEFAVNSIYDFTSTGTDWNVEGGTIVSGQGTYTISARTGVTTPYFNVKVRENDACGISDYLWRTGSIVAGITKPQSVMAGKLNVISSDTALDKASLTVMVYPNPANNIISVDIPTNLTKAFIKVFDIYGRQLKNVIPTSRSTNINIADLAGGLYIIEIFDGQKSIKKKVLKN